MSHQIIKQPNGKFAVWSSGVDDFIILDATKEEIITERICKAVSEIIADTEKICAQLDRGEKPYHQFTMTWKEANAFRRSCR